jgi:hypothetical protein
LWSLKLPSIHLVPQFPTGRAQHARTTGTSYTPGYSRKLYTKMLQTKMLHTRMWRTAPPRPKYLKSRSFMADRLGITDGFLAIGKKIDELKKDSDVLKQDLGEVKKDVSDLKRSSGRLKRKFGDVNESIVRVKVQEKYGRSYSESLLVQSLITAAELITPPKHSITTTRQIVEKLLKDKAPEKLLLAIQDMLLRWASFTLAGITCSSLKFCVWGFIHVCFTDSLTFISFANAERT